MASPTTGDRAFFVELGQWQTCSDVLTGSLWTLSSAPKYGREGRDILRRPRNIPQVLSFHWRFPRPAHRITDGRDAGNATTKLSSDRGEHKRLSCSTIGIASYFFAHRRPNDS
jgi:hypothetical protein